MALQDKVAQPWINFGRTGHPNQPGLEWKPYTLQNPFRPVEIDEAHGHGTNPVLETAEGERQSMSSELAQGVRNLVSGVANDELKRLFHPGCPCDR
jgi:hypothetical protein